jgi:murein L,D-transpeptidase YafK
MFSRRSFQILARIGVVAAAVGLAACDDDGGLAHRSLAPIPSETLALMEQAGVTKEAPTLIRAYKKEAELEVWKMRPDGRYVHLKTFPMCRWSGQLGPKTREGDRQVPEGFYSINPGQLNPNSSYYLSFNVGYPNAYDRALGHTGGTIMVHGVCSSMGCFSMTDRQIGEIYAIVRTSLNSGQNQVQMQSYPFHMTTENLAKHRLDPNIAFWKQLKEGADHFEVTKQEPTVGVCGKHYVFDAEPANGQRLDPVGACPPLKRDPQIAALVAEKQAKDDAKVAELAASGVKAIRLVYQDGGQHPAFTARVAEVSRPEALVPPTEIVLEDRATGAKGKAAARLASVKTPAGATTASASLGATQPRSGFGETGVAARDKAPAPEEPIKVSALAGESASGGKGSITGWLGLHKEPPPTPAAAAEEPAAPPQPAKTVDKTPTGKTTKGKTTAAKTPPTPPARDVPKKVTIGPLEKALRAAEAQK